MNVICQGASVEDIFGHVEVRLWRLPEGFKITVSPEWSFPPPACIFDRPVDAYTEREIREQLGEVFILHVGSLTIEAAVRLWKAECRRGKSEQQRESTGGQDRSPSTEARPSGRHPFATFASEQSGRSVERGPCAWLEVLDHKPYYDITISQWAGPLTGDQALLEGFNDWPMTFRFDKGTSALNVFYEIYEESHRYHIAPESNCLIVAAKAARLAEDQGGTPLPNPLRMELLFPYKKPSVRGYDPEIGQIERPAGEGLRADPLASFHADVIAIQHVLPQVVHHLRGHIRRASIWTTILTPILTIAGVVGAWSILRRLGELWTLIGGL